MDRLKNTNGERYGILYLERREHLALLLAVDEAVVVLHRDKWRQVVLDGVVYGRLGKLLINSQLMRSLCMAWTRVCACQWGLSCGGEAHAHWYAQQELMPM